MKGHDLDKLDHSEVQDVVQEARETCEMFERYQEDYTAILDGTTTQLKLSFRTDNACDLQRTLKAARELGLVGCAMDTGRARTGSVKITMRKNLDDN